MKDIRTHLYIILLIIIGLILLYGHSFPKITFPSWIEHSTIAFLPLIKSMDHGDYDYNTISEDYKEYEEGYNKRHSPETSYKNCLREYSGACGDDKKCLYELNTICYKSHDGILDCDDVSKLNGNPVYTCWAGYEDPKNYIHITTSDTMVGY